MSDLKSKQVLVMRKFKNQRTGKFVAQGAHASLGALLSIAKFDANKNQLIIPLHNPFVESWLKGMFRKITVYVDTAEEILELFEQAKALGLPCALIEDNGLTEYNGVKTITALGIGPGDPALIDTLTGNLPLF